MFNCFKKKELIIFTCETCSTKLFGRIISRYRDHCAKKGIIRKINYLIISQNFTIMFKQNLNKQLTNNEIKLLNRCKCIYHNSNLLEKIMKIEEETMIQFIEK